MCICFDVEPYTNILNALQTSVRHYDKKGSMFAAGREISYYHRENQGNISKNPGTYTESRVLVSYTVFCIYIFGSPGGFFEDSRVGTATV